MSECPPRVALLKMLDDGEEVPHLATCRECAEFVAQAGSVLSLVVGGVAEIQRAAAEEVDATIAGVPAHRIAATITSSPALRRSIFVRELLARADALYGSDPRRAMEFAEAAVGVCNAMRSAGAACPHHVDALKEHASILRRVGRHDEALDVLARAWSLASETDDCEHYRAVLSLATAIVYAEPDVARFDEAMACAEAAAAVLDVCGDARRAMIARHTHAHVLAVMGKDADAAAIMEAVVREPASSLSSRDLAIAHDLLAHCLVNVGRFDDAHRHASEAASRYAEAGDKIGAASVAHTAARAAAALGRFEESRATFDQSAEIIFAARLFDVWIIMRLDFVAAALRDDPAADVRHEVESVARVCFSSHHSGERSSTRRRYAADALDYLRRLAKRDALTTDSVTHVRMFVARNTEQPPVKFTPPAGADFVM